MRRGRREDRERTGGRARENERENRTHRVDMEKGGWGGRQSQCQRQETEAGIGSRDGQQITDTAEGEGRQDRSRGARDRRRFRCAHFAPPPPPTTPPLSVSHIFLFLVREGTRTPEENHTQQACADLPYLLRVNTLVSPTPVPPGRIPSALFQQRHTNKSALVYSSPLAYNDFFR